MRLYKEEITPVKRSIMLLASGDFTYQKVIENEQFYDAYHKFHIYNTATQNHFEVYYKRESPDEFLLEAKHLGYIYI